MAEYLVIAYRPDESEPALLRYPTLGEALQKVRDLIEADELDDDGPMFTEYAIRIDPPIPGCNSFYPQRAALPTTRAPAKPPRLRLAGSNDQ